MSIRLSGRPSRRRGGCVAVARAVAAQITVLVALAGLLATPAAAQGAKGIEGDVPRLTMAGVEKLVQASKNLKALENDPEVKRWAAKHEAEANRDEESGDESSGDNEDYEKAVALFESQPKLRRAIESTGLTVDSYFKTTMALGFAMMAHGVEKQYGKEQKVGNDVAGQNLLFVRQNEAKLDALMAEMKKYELKLGKEESADDQEESDEEPPR